MFAPPPVAQTPVRLARDSSSEEENAPTGDLLQRNRVFFLQLTVAGSTMGTAQEFRQLIDLMSQQQISPIIDRTLPMADAREGFAAMNEGTVRGKIVLTH